MKNRRKQKDLQVKLASIEQEREKAMKKRYSNVLETFYQMREQKKVAEDLQYFSEEEWRQKRRLKK